MKCGITDIARILGITTSAIRYFEKEHLEGTPYKKR